jgi:Restriction endonuclease AspBHI N-terminal/Restriction endonuclease
MNAERTKVVEFAALGRADLVVDAVYRGGTSGNAGDDPIHVLLPVGNQAGFRFRGSADHLHLVDLVAIYSDLGEPGWPDALDTELGRFIYYGDNRHPGHDLHDTPRKGNRILRDSFAALRASSSDRGAVPPFFVFTKGSKGRDVVFRGLAVPGAEGLSTSEDLVAIWRSREGSRFQNYRATFTILDSPVVLRSWIDSVVAGHPDDALAPQAWRDWIVSARYRPLRAPSAYASRSPSEQMPATAQNRELLRTVYEFFDDGYAFEPCAASLWRMSAGRVDYFMTRPRRDGGRDAIGVLRVGPETDAIELDFALEAKRYGASAGVGVRDLARLISRIRHRMFGVLVTTSFLDRQAYEELRADAHPIVVISGRDIVDILRAHGLGTPDDVSAWLNANFASSSGK